RATLDAYRSADSAVRKELEGAEQTVRRSEKEAVAREKRVQAHQRHGQGPQGQRSEHRGGRGE
ncbi:hypothetical protein HGB46_26390, partial [Nocardiopsis dassonvillei]|nr:hypothetical protein [Nocardiopsis dassonvillei]